MSGITSDWWEYAKWVKLPPVRLPSTGVNKKEFVELLQRQLKQKKALIPKMNKEEFIRLMYVNPEALLRRKKLRTLHELKKASKEYFDMVEERWWIEQQVQVMAELHTSRAKGFAVAYKKSKKQFLNNVASVRDFLISTKQEEKVKELEEWAFEHYKDLEGNEPKPSSIAMQNIVGAIRRLYLQGDYLTINQISDTMSAFVQSH